MVYLPIWLILWFSCRRIYRSSHGFDFCYVCTESLQFRKIFLVKSEPTSINYYEGFVNIAFLVTYTDSENILD